MGSGHNRMATRRQSGAVVVRLAHTDIVTVLFAVRGVGQIRGHSLKDKADDVCLEAAGAFGSRGGIVESVQYGERTIDWIPRVEVEFVMTPLMATALGRSPDGGRVVKMMGLAIVLAPNRVQGAVITPSGECTLRAFDKAWMVKLDGTIQLVEIVGVI